MSVAWNVANRCRLESGQTAAIHGAGPIGIGVYLTLRRRGKSQRFENGTTIAISDLAREPQGADTDSDAQSPVAEERGVETSLAPPAPGVSPFLQEVTRQSELADDAIAGRDVDSAVGAVLAIDTQMHEWEADTLDSDEQDRAREVLRRSVVRLGDLARSGAGDPRDLLAFF